MNGRGIECGQPTKTKTLQCQGNEMKSRKVGKVTDDYIEVPGFDIVLIMVVELSCAGHMERMNGSIDNKVEPGEPFNNFNFSTSMRKYWSVTVLLGECGVAY